MDLSPASFFPFLDEDGLWPGFGNTSAKLTSTEYSVLFSLFAWRSFLIGQFRTGLVSLQANALIVVNSLTHKPEVGGENMLCSAVADCRGHC